jgi:hypothetical protein
MYGKVQGLGCAYRAVYELEEAEGAAASSHL